MRGSALGDRVADARAPFAVATPGGTKGWADDVPRNWFAEADWRALDSYFGLDRVP